MTARPPRVPPTAPQITAEFDELELGVSMAVGVAVELAEVGRPLVADELVDKSWVYLELC